MLPVPDKERDILAFANELIEQCRVSVGMRSAYYRLMNAIAETGRYDGTKSLINLLFRHLDRTASHLYSPVELKFTMDFERPYPKFVYDRAAEVGKVVTRQWERSNTDILFGRGVFEALKYGACIPKQWPELDHTERDGTEVFKYKAKLVMPWNFGVYREDENDINEQEALCETMTLTLPEVWRRIWRLPKAEKLLERIRSHARRGEAGSEPTSFFHQVLSTSQINTGVQGMTQPVPGGIVQLNNDPNYAIMGPVVAADVVQMHELWVKDEHDYTTIQLIEPDILIAPLMKRSNLLIKDSRLQPYRLIQPNEVTNWFWGRSELVDMIEPQGLLSSWCDDFRRLVGMQVDKLIGFTGETGITDELYAQFRLAGYLNLGAGADIKDVTPKIPPELLPAIKWLIETVNQLGGFPNIMQGQGEQGVRAGVHASTLLKTASPTLRDRALLVERQCAIMADLTLQIREAKDASHYWIKADQPIKDVEDTKFLLSELPDDWRITVDSHSSSPIFSDENQQLVFGAHARGVVDAEYVIDNTNLPNKEVAKLRLREKEKKQAELLAAHPELLHDIFKHKGGKK
jgi:hypothetical protein